MSKKVLFVSGSLGLGHIGRDLEIARELRRQNKHLTVDWLAAPPGDQVVLEAGERLLPQASELGDENAVAEGTSEGGTLSLVRYLFGAREDWRRSVAVIERVMGGDSYDLLIGDETYALITAFKKDPSRKTLPFVMIYDFVGVDAFGWSPLERLGAYLWNRSWSRNSSDTASFVDLSLFIGEEEDVPDRSFGPFLPNRRAWARSRCEFVGYVLPFRPSEYLDRSVLRQRLGYAVDAPLVVCSIGGTAIGKGLLELCGRAYPAVAERMPGLQMVLVAGPRLDPETLTVPEGVTTKGYVSDLYKHMAASDLAVVQGGGTITLELTALRRPFLYFPIPGHFEQEIHVAGRLERHGAGIRMDALRTTPEALAQTIVANLGTVPDTPTVPWEGARLAARRISRFL